MNRPTVSSFGGSYLSSSAVPNGVIIFNDGVVGSFFGGVVFSSVTAQAFQSGSNPNERGQLFLLPFPVRIFGCYGWMAQATSGNVDLVLYSDPLGSPVAQMTSRIDQHTISGTVVNRFNEMFASTYDVPANTPFAVVAKPAAAANVTAYFKTLDSQALSVVDVWGTAGYGVTRNGGSGAFTQQNSGKDHYFLGLIASAFQNPASPLQGVGI